MLRVYVRRFILDRRGGTAMIFGLSLVPIIFMTGMALDFTSAAQKRTRLNAAADGAALAAVTPYMMTQSNSVALTAATNMFNAEAANLGGATVNAPTITISNAGLVRTVTVSYTATSTNNFPNVFASVTGASHTTWPLSGSATATSYSAPNINFYLMLNNTSAQGGCAFACHESDPAADNLGNPNGEDNYTLANKLGVVTRVELMAQATSSLMTTAGDTEVANNA